MDAKVYDLARRGKEMVKKQEVNFSLKGTQLNKINDQIIVTRNGEKCLNATFKNN